jgi:hypothetical protein
MVSHVLVPETMSAPVCTYDKNKLGRVHDQAACLRPGVG